MKAYSAGCLVEAIRKPEARIHPGKPAIADLTPNVIDGPIVAAICHLASPHQALGPSQTKTL
jgi:hypothetical protein